jgi:hypothetical protein
VVYLQKQSLLVGKEKMPMQLEKIQNKMGASEEKEEDDSRRKDVEGWVKCNVDASFIDEDKTGSWGVCD